MNMNRPALILHPLHESTAEIVKCFMLAKPLTPDQVNFLDWHQHQLSHPDFDPILRYYLKKRNARSQKLHTSFLLPHEKLNQKDVTRFKKRLALMLSAKPEHEVVINLSQEQFLQFKEYTIQELIFWHGNQFLTGAPFYPGGIPPTIYFQWGNYFGIIKYVVIPGEKSIMGNLLIHFLDMQDRNLDECVQDYNKHLKEDIKLQNELLHHKEIAPHYEYASRIKTPELTLSKSYLIDHIQR